MNIRHTAPFSLGISASLWVLWTAAVSAQPYPDLFAPEPALPITPWSSSLGGPITPTQPDFFAENKTKPLPTTPIEDTSSSSFGAQPIRPTSNKPPAPFVDDVPRRGGLGIINVKVD